MGWMDGERFRYEGYDLDPDSGRLECRYSLGPWRFAETISFEVPGAVAAPGAALEEAARLVHLLAGVSYYKTAAPPVVDLGDVPTTAGERRFLRMFFVDGLGEFAYRNGLDLSGLEIVGPDRGDGPGPPAPAAAAAWSPAAWSPAAWSPAGDRPLVPFGAGIDSIVTVEAVRRHHPDTALFVVGRDGERYGVIERAAAVTGLPVVRADRKLDPAVLRSETSGFLNGHVPVTGILSALAVMAAVMGGHGTVVMSNERSASEATIRADGRAVNHQWSKGDAFETGFRALLEAAFSPPPDYFSLLRTRSELWVAREFAALDRYHDVFCSCNRAFLPDPVRRLDSWCGTCDKCCFIDLVLAPFLPAEKLDGIFGSHEPLGDRGLEQKFRALLAVGGGAKPFECVGDVAECRAAAVLAARRDDRAGNTLLQDLAGWARDAEPSLAGGSIAGIFEPKGAGHVPPGFADGDG
jgi:UDP-N-acetyl-alpha-D-muramoyl-L-alanyl-L-glutamate epimerase